MASVSISMAKGEAKTEYAVAANAPTEDVEIRLDDTKWTSWRELRTQIDKLLEALRERGNLQHLN